MARLAIAVLERYDADTASAERSNKGEMTGQHQSGDHARTIAPCGPGRNWS